MTVRDSVHDDLDASLAALTDEELEAVAGASVALDIARLLYRAREHRGLTQCETAHRAGVQQQVVSRYEGGTANITVKTLEQYLRRLGTGIELRLVDEETGELIESLVLNDRPDRIASYDPQLSDEKTPASVQ